MAVQTGSLALSSDLRSWYSTLNTIISNYSNNTTMTLPTSYKIIAASDINTYYNKLTALKSDTYLRYAAFPSWTAKTVGTLITPYVTSLGNLGSVRCKNSATNYKGSCSSGTFSSNGFFSNGSNDFGGPLYYHFNQTNCNGGCWNGYVGYYFVAYFNGSHGTNGTRSFGSNGSNGFNSNGSTIDIFCSCASKTNNG